MRNIASQARRFLRDCIKATPGALDLGQYFFAAHDYRCKERPGAIHFLCNHIGNYQVVEKCRAPILDLVTQRDPQVSCDSFGRRDLLPISDDRFLHPFQVNAVVDMTHMIDVVRQDADRVMISFTHHR